MSNQELSKFGTKENSVESVWEKVIVGFNRPSRKNILFSEGRQLVF